MELQQQSEPRARRGRKPGSRDSKPRVRRTRAEIAAGQSATPGKVKRPKESQIQGQFIKWLDQQPAPDKPGHKLGEWIWAVPNGIWIPGDVQTRMRIIMSQRRLGMRKGAPDVTIAFPMHDWHGCFIEVKRDRDQTAPGQIKEEQRGYLERLRDVGYYVRMCVGLEECCEAVREYIRGDLPPPFPWEDGGR